LTAIAMFETVTDSIWPLRTKGDSCSFDRCLECMSLRPVERVDVRRDA
jgi:hypothetical protein